MLMKARDLLFGAASGLVLAIAGKALQPRPGRFKTLRVAALEARTESKQPRIPVKQFTLYLDGFHFENGNRSRQVPVRSYCSILSDDLIQCILFDGVAQDARLIGVEYMISSELFARLPEDERLLWHSHEFAVKSGQLVAPGLTKRGERELMARLRSTYGKAWHTWDPREEPELPTGIPKLMMGFTGEKQLRPDMMAERDLMLGVDSAEARKERNAFKESPILDGADAWERGDVLQLQLTPTGMTYEHPAEQ